MKIKVGCIRRYRSWVMLFSTVHIKGFKCCSFAGCSTRSGQSVLLYLWNARFRGQIAGHWTVAWKWVGACPKMEALLQLRMLPVLFILFFTKILPIQETVTLALTAAHRSLFHVCPILHWISNINSDSQCWITYLIMRIIFKDEYNL